MKQKETTEAVTSMPEIKYPYLRVAVMYDEMTESVKQFNEQMKTLPDLVDWDNDEFKILVNKIGELYNEVVETNQLFDPSRFI